MRPFLIAVFALAILACPPVFAADPEPAKEAAAPAAAADPGASEAQISKMRERWRKMPSTQREEMRQKGVRRVQERYERLSPQEQAQINSIINEVGKLSKEQRSIYFAQIHEQRYKERLQKKLMKDQEAKPIAEPAATPPVEAPAAAPAPAPPPSLAAEPVPAKKK